MKLSARSRSAVSGLQMPLPSPLSEPSISLRRACACRFASASSSLTLISISSPPKPIRPPYPLPCCVPMLRHQALHLQEGVRILLEQAALGQDALLHVRPAGG